MRKLLVVSQKGGVGKTTTSVNLAATAALAGTRVLLIDADPLSSVSTALNLIQFPDRRRLRELGVDLPGTFCENVLPGLDVLSPYEGGSCGDAELDELIALLDTSAVRQSYGCVIVDAPPFLGANPSQLLAAADEYLLVMRAEPLAHRTLPAFQELVARARKGIKPVPMRGILLTLPEGESVGGRWEREMRGRLGSRILPHAIPYDEEVAKALLFGQIASVAHPESPAVRAYVAMTEHLGLAAEALTAPALSTSGLVLAGQERCLAGTRSGISDVGPMLTAETPSVQRPDPLPLPAVKPPSRTVPVLPANPSKRPSGVRRRAKPTLHSLDLPTPESVVAELAPANDGSAELPPPRDATPSDASQPWWLVWTAFGVLGGVGLRFVELPTKAFPIAVGLAVTVLTVLVLKLLMRTPEERTASPAPAANARRPSRRVKRLPPQDSTVRLSALAQRVNAARRLREGEAD